MKSFVPLTVLTAIVLPIFTSMSYADTLVYNNSTLDGGYYLPMNSDYNEEFLDYGSSSGGLVSKFEIGYGTTVSNPGTLYVSFWQGTTRWNRGNLIKTITITGLDGFTNFKEYTIPEEERFVLPPGNFGYSYEFSWSYNESGPLLASGGLLNENYYWLYYINKWYGSEQVGGGYAGFYMKVYTGPALADITCDITGSKFDDTDGDGTWDAGEPGLPGWEMYIDENGDGNYQVSEPNVVTDPNGMYLFENLEFADPNDTKTFVIQETMKDGWTQTLPGGPDYEYTVVAEPNNMYGPYDFGNTDQVVSEITVSGHVKTAEGVRIKGVNVSSDTGETAVTDAHGYYEFSFVAPYSGTIQVGQINWTFTPPSRTYSGVVTNQADQDYSAAYTVNYGGGNGTAASPYLIYNAAQLNRIGAEAGDWNNKYFKLMADIDLSGYDGQDGRPSFNRIGYYINFVDDAAFLGVFDGNGYTISNFTFESNADNDAIGLFGNVGYHFGSSTEIKNVKLLNVNVSSGDTFIGTGALIGSMNDGIISNCSVEGGTVTGLYSHIGGLVGLMWGGSLSECSAENLTVSGNSSVGGLVAGGSSDASVTDCYADCTVSGDVECGGMVGDGAMTISRSNSAGSVTVTDRSAGGLIGSNGGTIEYCYSTATVICNAGDEIGGLIGRNSNPAFVSNCYTSGEVYGVFDVGGLIGFCYETTIENCYAVGPVDAIISSTKGGLIGNDWDGLSQVTGSFWDTQTTGVTTSGRGTGLLTDDMQNKQTYLDAGWDFTDETTNGTEDIWQLCDGTIAYPELAWNTTSLCGTTTLILPAIEDTYIKEDTPDSNYGDATGISCGLSDSGAQRAFVKFDLSSVPEGQVIVSATLQLAGSFLTFPTPEVEVYYTSNAWDEMTATWNDPPTIYSDPALDQTLVSIDLNTWDVTEKADRRYTQDQILSLALRTDELTVTTCGFNSREWFDPDTAPKLIVQYAPIFGGGKGTADDPYQIWTGEQMNSIGLYSNRWDRCYKLMDDISMVAYTGDDYNQIGYLPTTPNAGFKGVFDGDGHTISDFQSVPLFNLVSWGRIQELGLIGPVVSGDGALVNRLEFSQIAECWVDGGSVNGGSSVGGLVGNVVISNIGGCWSSATVTGANDVGGLIGQSNSLCRIEHCSAVGSVTGQDAVGGFIGSATDTAFTHCYSAGQVSGTTDVGGFCGAVDYFYQSPDIVVSCFWDYQTSGTTQSAIGTGMPTGEMKNLPMYLNAGWDFVGETVNGRNDDWAMPSGDGYPVLWYQLPAAPPLPSFAGGDGTQGNPYQIATVEQLNSIGHHTRLLDKHFQLVNDLDLAGQSFTMIADGGYAFMGSFDGNLHAIRNISISSPVCHTNIGFIGSVYAGHVFNVILPNVSVQFEYAQNVGSLVGLNRSGRIENCHSQNADVLGQWPVGGLVGINYWHASISKCSVIGSVAESNILNMLSSGVGGLVGENSWWSTIESSGANATVSGGDMLGGLVGNNIIFAQLTDCYAIGTITTTDDYAGGLAGRTIGSNDFTRCYAACEITAPAEALRIGALAGSESSGTYTDCFWDDQINGDLPEFGSTNSSTLLIDTVGETTANMQMAATYQSIGWDFDNVWHMRCEGVNYPRLRGEPVLLGDFVCPEGVEINDLLVLMEEWLAEVLSLTADISPNGGDGKVDLSDWTHLANAWQTSQGQPGYDSLCDLAPETPDGHINEMDLSVFADQWLYRSARFADIAPVQAPDGRVDLLDYVLFAENWLVGLD